MMRRFWMGASALLLCAPALAAPTPSKQALVTRSGVGTTPVADKPTVYGYPLSLTFTKADAGKMFEIVVDSPKPITIELWSGDIPRGTASWTKGHTFLGSSGRTASNKPSFKWMIEPGQYTALFLATAPAGEKPDQFLVTYGKEIRVPSEADKAEWDKAVAAYNLGSIRAAQAKRAAAPGFTAIATDRNPVTLGQYRGKVVLVTFWSSAADGWREDIGYIDGLYHLFHDKGFEMVSFCLDTEQTAFDEMMAYFTPAWKQVYDGRTGNSAIAAKWGVEPIEVASADGQGTATTYSGTYSNFLIDGQGRIFCRNTFREALQKQVKAALAENDTLKEALRNAPDEAPAETSAN